MLDERDFGNTDNLKHWYCDYLSMHLHLLPAELRSGQ